MTTTKLDTILQRSEALHQRYGDRFAGRSRVTRDPEEMAQMWEEARQLLEEARFLLPAPPEDAMSRLRERSTLYRDEEQRIREAQKGGAAAREGAELAAEANALFAQYARHFAGRQRSTRDLFLLGHLGDQLRAIEERMVRLEEGGLGDLVARNLEVVRNQLGLQAEEMKAIEAARDALSDEEAVSVLATRANELFAWYRYHFAGLSRLSRDPALLERLIRALREVREEMRALVAPPARLPNHRENQEIVRGQLEGWEAELAEVRKVRETTTVDALVGAFGEEANDVMASYRDNFAGKDRSTRDPQLLGALCDRMQSVCTQAIGLARHTRNEVHDRNLGIMRDSLEMLNREYALVRKANEDGSGTGPQGPSGGR